MDVRRTVTQVLAILLIGCGVASAQATAGEGRTLERRGRFEEADSIYRRVIEDDPANRAAWLGLERVLTELERLESIVPLVSSVLADDPELQSLHELELRVWSALGEPDSVSAAARRWISISPQDVAPYRQWAFALARADNADRAVAVLEEARTRYGATTLAPEMATLYASMDRWAEAAAEWARAVETSRTHVALAGQSLRAAPESDRDAVLELLTGADGPLVLRRLAAELLVSWNRADDGWRLLEQSLSEDRDEAVVELRLFADRIRRMRTRDAARVRAYVLERLGEIAEGAEGERARLDAAQAYADADDFGGARRMLDGLLDASDGVPTDAAAAMATLISVTAESGRLDEAEERFDAWKNDIRPSDAQRLRELIGWRRVIEGEFDKAQTFLRGDSSIGAQAILGWAALYEGNLRIAEQLFVAAGPFAVSRVEATRRTIILALLQGVARDSVPELGEALLSLERADTAGALDGLVRLAADLPPDSGRSPVLTYAGDLARHGGDLERSETLLLEALSADSAGPAAPAAEYALGTVLARKGKPEAAITRLEHMILTFPGSALVPEARRLLDQVRGAIPAR